MSQSAEQTRATLLRRTTFGVWFLVLLMTPFEIYHRLPKDLWNDVGTIGLLDNLVPVGNWLLAPLALQTLKLFALAICAAGVLFPYLPRQVSLACALAVWLLDAATKSIQAYPNHAQIVPLLVLLIVALAGADRSVRRARLVIWLSGLAVAVPYTFIGVTRVVEGGVAYLLSDSILRSMLFAADYHSNFGFTTVQHLIDLPGFDVVVRVALLAVTLTEVGSAAALVSSRWRTVWLANITLFHVSSLVLLNIFFWENLLLIWATFGPLWTKSRLTYGGDGLTQGVTDRVESAVA